MRDPALNSLDVLIKIRRGALRACRTTLAFPLADAERAEWVKWQREISCDLHSLLAARRMLLSLREMVPHLRELAA